MALHNAKIHSERVQLATQLQEALVSRAVIDQAKGILMERQGLGADQAFAALKAASRNSNVRLRAVAQLVVDLSENGARPDDRR